MVLNVVAFEPVDSLNIPIKFCPAVEVKAAEVAEILLVVVVLPITLYCHRTCYSRFFINPVKL
jgi:hypothetical protein